MAKQRYPTLDLRETFDVGLRLDSKVRSGFTFRTSRSELTSVLYRRPESPKAMDAGLAPIRLVR